MTRRRFPWALSLGLLCGTLLGRAPAEATEPRELVVYAAASLRDAFQGLSEAFERGHPGVSVRMNFAGSQDLRVQIEHGARVDVFASADEKHMKALRDHSMVERPTLFAQNEPVLIVPATNPAKLVTFADLPKAERVVLGAPEVPIGAYAGTILGAAGKLYGADFGLGVARHIRSRELNVRQVLAKVALGEADAGIVYKTDALTAKERITSIAIPPSVNVVASYPIAMVSAAPHPDLARAWIAFVLSSEGQAILRATGFRAATVAARGTN
jgi:molybdate transport system substrate-binding protein